MSILCDCLRKRTREEPTPLDTEIEFETNFHLIHHEDARPNERQVAYSLDGARGPNFDFVSTDDGSHYIATFRALWNGQIMGHNSYPIPKTVFEKITVTWKKKVKTVYNVILDTGGQELLPYFRAIEFFEHDRQLRAQGIYVDPETW